MADPLPETVAVHYRWTVAELIEATRWHLRQGKANRVRLAIYVLVVVLVLASVLLSYGHEGYEQQRWIGIGLAVYLVLLMGLQRWLTLWWMRRNYRKSAACDSEIDWLITPTTLRVKYVHGSSELNWGAFIKAVETPKGLLLYPQPIIFHWLPRAGFVSESAFKATAEMAQAKIAAYRRLP